MYEDTHKKHQLPVLIKALILFYYQTSFITLPCNIHDTAVIIERINSIWSRVSMHTELDIATDCLIHLQVTTCTCIELWICRCNSLQHHKIPTLSESHVDKAWFVYTMHDNLWKYIHFTLSYNGMRKYPLFGAQSVLYFRIPCFVYSFILSKKIWSVLRESSIYFKHILIKLTHNA